MLSGAYQTVSARNNISAVFPALRSPKYMKVRTTEAIRSADAPVTITPRIAFMPRAAQSPASISKGMSTKIDKKFIFMIY
ncbi:hypothetical protein NXW58_10570 [Bacteroides faecis]|jgi:hypothetical protein|nr:hypothetical protein NXW58_10570 [Bacteroides faecis]